VRGPPNGGICLFKHEKPLLHPARVEGPNPNYASILQEGLGGASGEITAAMQYISQSFRCRDPEIRDLMLDIGAEELSHIEIIATTINLLNGNELAGTGATVGSVEAQTLGGLGPQLANSSGCPWTAAYVSSTGDPAADLLSDIAAEQRAKVVYERLYRQINDKGVRETIEFLLNREEAHNALFREAFNRIKDTGSQRDFGVERHAQQYFDLSTPGRHFAAPTPTPPSFNRPDRNQHDYRSTSPAGRQNPQQLGQPGGAYSGGGSVFPPNPTGPMNTRSGPNQPRNPQ